MNPYADKPEYAFWRRSISQRSPFDVDPVTDTPFIITAVDRIATAGSCFAQHIARTLSAIGFQYLVTEAEPGTSGAKNENFGVFPARFGNVYTARQLLQLLQRAYGLFEPIDSEWQASDGGYLDPFRPRIQRDGFASIDLLRADREHHLAAVRQMFEVCDVFVFTLGLTEGWRSIADGAVFPLAPGAVTDAIDNAAYEFHNFTVAEVSADLIESLDLLRSVNPAVRVILTVSPVPLIATYEDRHVLVSTTYSKSVLRVAAETATKARPDVAYFPSYEIITGAPARSRFYEDDLREVTSEGVAHVMSIFLRHYTDQGGARIATSAQPAAADGVPTTAAIERETAKMREYQQIVCDETALEPSR